MKLPKLARAAAVTALATATTACSIGYQPPPFPVPEDPGLYALLPDDSLRRLDGDREWEVETWPERSDLSPYVEFVVHDPILRRDSRPRSEIIEIWKVAWVRSEIAGDGLAMPIEGSEWAVAQLEPFRVPVAYEHPEGRPEVVHIMPQAPLDPGLYSLRLNKVGTARVARLGIEWNSVDKRRYSAANCVDRYVGSESGYRTCSGADATPAAASTEGLEITLVDPLRRDGNLIIQGVVVNTTGQAKRIPLLQANLQDQAGRTLSRQVIEPQTGVIGPGERMRFKTEVIRPPSGVARIRVTFASATSATMQ